MTLGASRVQVRRGLAILAVTAGCLAAAQGATAQTDTTPPETTIVEGPAEGSTIGTDDVGLRWTSSEEGSSFQCIEDGVKLTRCEDAFDTGAADGRHTFSVAATDSAGNTDPSPATRTFTVDLGAPPEPPAGCDIDGNIITATNGNDTRTGTAGSDIMYGLGGNDLLRGGARPDCISGEAGADRLFGGLGSDYLFGGSGNDVVSGGPGNDLLEGSAGADRLTDFSGRSSFDGGAGNDTIRAQDTSAPGRRIADRVRCGTGRDIAYVDRADTVSRDCERVRRR